MFESEGNGLSRRRAVDILLGREDPCYSRHPSGIRDYDLVSASDPSGGNGAGKAAEIEIGPIDPLHGHAEGFLGQLRLDIDGFEVFEQRRPFVPRRARARSDHVISEPRRNGNGNEGIEAKLRCEAAEILIYLV